MWEYAETKAELSRKVKSRRIYVYIYDKIYIRVTKKALFDAIGKKFRGCHYSLSKDNGWDCIHLGL